MRSFLLLALFTASTMAAEKSAEINSNTTLQATLNTSIQNQSFTVEFWIRRDDVSNVPFIVHGQAGNLLEIGYVAEETFRFGFSGSNLELDSPILGLWEHWVCVFEHDSDTGLGTRRIYKNGLHNSTNSDGDIPGFTGTGTWTIGEGFTGGYDDLRIWNRALSKQEIQGRYHRSLNASEIADESLIAYWPISDGATPLAEESGRASDLAAITGPAPVIAPVGSASDLGGDPENTITLTEATNLDAIYQAIETANLSGQFTLLDLTTLSGNLTPGSLAPTPVAVPLIIQGPGFDVLTLDANNQARHFEILSGASLKISDLTLENGQHEEPQASLEGYGGDAGRGGSILVNEATHFEAERVVFQSNTVVGGAGGVAKSTPAGRGGDGGYLPPNTSQGPQVNGLEGTRGSLPLGGFYGTGGIYIPNRTPGDGGRDALDGQPGIPGFAYQGGGPGGDGGGGGGGAATSAFPGVGGPGGDGGDGGDGGRGGFGAGTGAGGAGGGGGAGGTDNTDTTNVAAGRSPEHGAGGRGGSPGTGGSTASSSTGGTIWGGNAATTQRIPGGRGGQSGGGAGGSGLGGAIFVGTHAGLSLRSVRFLDNQAIGGVGGENASSGGSDGASCYMMDAAAFSQAPFNVRLDRDSDFHFDKLYGRSEAVQIYVGIHDSFGVGSGNTHISIEPFRGDVFQNVGGIPENNFTLSDGLTADPDPFPIYPEIHKLGEDSSFNAYLIEYQKNPSDPHLAGRLLDIVRDGASIRAFFAEFQASKAERDASRTAEFQSTLDEHLNAYLAPETGVLALFEEALGSYQKVFSSPAAEAVFREAIPHRDFVPLVYDADTPEETISLYEESGFGAIGSFVTPQPPLGTGYADLSALYDILAGYGKATARVANLYHGRDLPGDRNLANTLLEKTTRTLTITASLLEGYLPSPERRPDELLAALDGYTGALNAMTDIQAKLAENINSLGYPDDFLLLVGDHEQEDTFNKLSDLFYEPGVNGSLAELNRALEAMDDANTASSTYNKDLDSFITARGNELAAVEDRLLELGDYDSNDASPNDPPGEIDDQLIRINNARIQIQKNRNELSRLHREIDIEVNRVAQQQGNNLRTATIRTIYLNRQRNLDGMIAYNETSQQAADDIAGFFEFDPKNAAAILGIIAKGVAYQFKIADSDDIRALENQKADLAGAEIMEIADANNRALSIDLQAYIKNRLLDSSRIALDSRLAANNFRQEINRLAALDGERRRLLKRAQVLATNPARLFSDPIKLARYQTASTDATRRFHRSRHWVFMIMRALEYKWNEPFEQDEFDKTDLFAARNADDLLDLLEAMHTFDDLRSDFGFYDYNEDQEFTLSLKKDILGYPDTTEGTLAFRDFVLNNVAENSGAFSIKFDTIRQFEGFFEGARYQSDGAGGYELPTNGLNRGFALNKISWLQVRAVGDFQGAFDPNNTGEANSNNISSNVFRYGGTTYIRPIQVGTLSEPDSPDSLVNELVPYETQRYDPTQGFPFQPVDGPIEDAISVFLQDTSLLFTAPDVSDVSSSDRFGDRSVAASEWELSIRMTGDYASVPSLIDDITIIFNHSYVSRTEAEE